MVLRSILVRFSIALVVLLSLIYFPLSTGLSALSALVIWRLFNAGSEHDLTAYFRINVNGLFGGSTEIVRYDSDTKTNSTMYVPGRYDLASRKPAVERSPLSSRPTNISPSEYDSPKRNPRVADRLVGERSPADSLMYRNSPARGTSYDNFSDNRSLANRSDYSRFDNTQLDSSTYGASSPSLSAMSRASLERSVISPSLPLGSYPWIVPKVHSPASKNSMHIETIPVKIRISKPSRSLIQPSNEPESPESSRQIIQAFKVLSRKRPHTVESDEDADNSNSVSKKRPVEFEHNLYCSQLNYTDSSLQEVAENAEESTAEPERSANLDSRSATQNGPTVNIRQPQAPVVQGPIAHHSPVTNGSSALTHLGVFRSVSNKRLRPFPDSDDQQTKKRGCDEIVSSLSSSVALLDPTVLRPPRKRRNEDKSLTSRIKTRNTTQCAEVQTLPSPILREEPKQQREDKGTETDKVVADSFCNGCNSPSYSKEEVMEKKVTGVKAAALLKSALKKFADSGDLITPNSSLSSSIASESSHVNEKESVSTSEQPASMENSQTPKLAFSFGQPTTANALSPEPPNATVKETSQPEAKLAFTFEASPASATPAVAPVQSAPAALNANVSSIASPSSISPLPNKSVGFTFEQTTVSTSGTTLPISFSSSTSLSVPKNDIVAPGAGSSVEIMKQQETKTTFSVPISSNEQKALFTFGSTNSAQSSLDASPKVPSAPTNTQSNPVPATSAGPASLFTFEPSNKVSTAPLLTTLPSSTALSATATLPSVTTTSANPKPGGFSFTPSKPAFNVATTTASQPAFAFGSNSSSKPETKSLFGMPIPQAATTTAAEPPKLFGSSGGFNFTSSNSNQAKSAFASASLAKPAATGSAPDTAASGGFSFSGLNRQTAAASTESANPAFSFGSSTGQKEKNNSAFAFMGGSTPNFNSSFGTRTTEANPTTFGTPATTAPPSFFATSSTPTTTPSFGSTGGFTSLMPSATPLFGATAATTAPTTTTASAPTFGASVVSPGFSSSSTLPAFGASATPSASVFGSSGSFGSNLPAFGSNQPGFGVNPTPSFGSVASSSSLGTTQPAPAFESGLTTAASPSFGSGSFSLSGTAPTFGATSPFGSSEPATSAFGAAAPAAPVTTQAAMPFAFSAPSTAQSGAPTAFNFSSSAPAPRHVFSFNSSSSTPAGPFSFQGAPPNAPGAPGGTMFSIGSGSSAPRSRATPRARKK